MKLLTLWLAPAILLSSQERFARLSEWEGSAEIQVDPADSWEPALRNMPVPELAWLRTGASSRLELELDEGSVLRVGPESLVELSDYTRLSTGQRVTLISLDRGLAYVTGEAQGADAMVLAVPGAQITVTRHTRLRLRAGTNSSAIAVLEGAARFSCPTAELELREEQMVQVDPAQTARFSLYREVPPAELDDWSRARSGSVHGELSRPRARTSIWLGGPGCARHVDRSSGFRHGVETKGGGRMGAVPERQMAMVRRARLHVDWRGALGLAALSSRTLDAGNRHGLVLGSRHGHRLRAWRGVLAVRPGSGLNLLASSAKLFLGEVYWLYGRDLAGWGPLSPGEEWKPGSMPRLYLIANSTFARWAPYAREIDPAAAAVQPKEPLSAAGFVTALPSPPLPAARLKADRPVLRAGSTRVVPHLAGVSYEEPAQAARPAISAQPAAPAAQAAPEPVIPAQPAAQPMVVVTTPPAPLPPEEIYYPVPVYTGIVVVNPPEPGHHKRPRPPSQGVRKPAPAPAAPAAPAAPQTPAAPEPQQPSPKPPLPRNLPPHGARPSQPAPGAARPIPRNQAAPGRPEPGPQRNQ